MIDLDDPDAEPRVPTRAVCYIATLAQDLMGKTASSASEDQVDEDDPVADVLEDRGMDAVEEELRMQIDDLDVEAQIDLVALMWLGRDDGDWAELRKLSEQEHNEATADYLLGTPLLADYLMAGLNKFELDCTELL